MDGPSREKRRLLGTPTNSLHWSVFAFFIFAWSCSLAQTDSIPARSFRYFNPQDLYSIFLENESRALPSESDSTYSITITVTNIRKMNGVIRFKFYNDTTPLNHPTGFLRIVIQKSEIVNHTITATYHGFVGGNMGIALHDDENENMKLDIGWFLPEEGYAFSDYYHKSFLKPQYSDFRFLLNGNRHVIMKMRYH